MCNHYCFCSDVTYAIHLESINLLLTLLSIQLFQNQIAPHLQLYQHIMNGEWYLSIFRINLISMVVPDVVWEIFNVVADKHLDVIFQTGFFRVILSYVTRTGVVLVKESVFQFTSDLSSCIRLYSQPNACYLLLIVIMVFFNNCGLTRSIVFVILSI